MIAKLPATPALVVAIKLVDPRPTFVTVTEFPDGDKLTIPVGLADQVTVCPGGTFDTENVAELQNAVVEPVTAGRLSTSET